MDDHICLQVIDEPTIKDIDPLTGEETIEDDNSDLQNFLKTWEKVDMNPDKLNKEEESFEFQQRRCYSEARQHFASANEEFRFMSIILENVISSFTDVITKDSGQKNEVDEKTEEKKEEETEEKKEAQPFHLLISSIVGNADKKDD